MEESKQMHLELKISKNESESIIAAKFNTEFWYHERVPRELEQLRKQIDYKSSNSSNQDKTEILHHQHYSWRGWKKMHDNWNNHCRGRNANWSKHAEWHSENLDPWAKWHHNSADFRIQNCIPEKKSQRFTQCLNFEQFWWTNMQLPAKYFLRQYIFFISQKQLRQNHCLLNISSSFHKIWWEWYYRFTKQPAGQKLVRTHLPTSCINIPKFYEEQL